MTTETLPAELLFTVEVDLESKRVTGPPCERQSIRPATT
jgi:hypothetical protein